MEGMIDSRWEIEKGRWSEECLDYLDRRIEKKEKGIKFEVTDFGREAKIYFHGPTGFEIFYLDDLIRRAFLGKKPTSEELCICAGTINSWPACYVSFNDVILIIKEYYKNKLS